jgi:hypothetical protein
MTKDKIRISKAMQLKHAVTPFVENKEFKNF